MMFLFLPFRIFWLIIRFNLVWMLPKKLQKIFGLFSRSVRHSKIESLNLFLTSMGPLYVKVGQFMALRPDIVGTKMASLLSGLADSLPPFPFKDVKRIIEADFHQPLESLFTSFDETPVAAASVAQVHYATVEGDIPVAVKVLRPDIERKFAVNLKKIRKWAVILEFFSKSIRLLRMVQLCDEMKKWSLCELDLRLEAANAIEFRKKYNHKFHIHVIFTDVRLSSKRVLTEERLQHVTKVDNMAQLEAWHINTSDLVENLADSLVYQVFDQGYFHADIHPGNIFINQNGDICPVDFGIMGRLSMSWRIFMAIVLQGFILRDYPSITRALIAYEILPKHTDEDMFTGYVRVIGERIFAYGLFSVSIESLVDDFFHLLHKFQFRLTPELALLNKTLIMTESIATQLGATEQIFLALSNRLRVWLLTHNLTTYRMYQLTNTLQRLLQEKPTYTVSIPKVWYVLWAGSFLFSALLFLWILVWMYWLKN